MRWVGALRVSIVNEVIANRSKKADNNISDMRVGVCRVAKLARYPKGECVVLRLNQGHRGFGALRARLYHAQPTRHLLRTKPEPRPLV
jgi:hypothetical protein